jgi:hypothetical protein
MGIGLTFVEKLLLASIVALFALLCASYFIGPVGDSAIRGMVPDSSEMQKETDWAGKPDLIVSKIAVVGLQTGTRFEGSIPNNEPFHLVPTIKNIGKGASSLDQNVKIAVGVDSGIGAMGPCRQRTVTLNPGEEIECNSANRGGLGNSEGPHKIFAIVDYTEIVPEADDGNNKLAMDFAIGGGDCTDSDWGKNFYVYGETKGLDGSGSDVCATFWDQYSLIEHYCEGSYHKFATFNCPNGCKDGACVNSTG